MAVGIHSGELAQTQPAEVLLTGGARHLVTPIHLLDVGATARAALAVLRQPVPAEGLLHGPLDDLLPEALLHELLPLRAGRQVFVLQTP